MSELIDFIKENSKLLVIIISVVSFLLVIIKITGIDLNPPKPESKLIQEVIVETFTGDEEMLEDSQKQFNLHASTNFCESYLGNSLELDGACKQLTEKNCASTKCCGYVNGNCVAGGLDGPTYKKDKDGKLITIDSYYYLGKCHGQRCPT